MDAVGWIRFTIPILRLLSPDVDVRYIGSSGKAKQRIYYVNLTLALAYFLGSTAGTI